MDDGHSGVVVDENIAGAPPVFRLGGTPSMRQSVFGSIHRSPDSSYVLCTEVQMASAVKMPADGKPRMSLILPAPALAPDDGKAGKSEKAGVESLLQVDCVVTGTKVFQTRGANNASLTPSTTSVSL